MNLYVTGIVLENGETSGELETRFVGERNVAFWAVLPFERRAKCCEINIDKLKFTVHIIKFFDHIILFKPIGVNVFEYAHRNLLILLNSMLVGLNPCWECFY